jgi:diacylglycerol kinase family enzyme
MRKCVIFNPTARGEKARRFRRHLDAIATECALKMTAAPGDARKLAKEAVAEGFEIIVAGGGDGTVNEVLNGIGMRRMASTMPAWECFRWEPSTSSRANWAFPPNSTVPGK